MFIPIEVTHVCLGNKMKKVISSVLLFGLSFTASADYTIDAEVFDNDKVIGKPRLIVKANEKARVFLDGVYDLSLIVNPKDNGSIDLDTKIKVDNQRLMPTLNAALGQEMRVESTQHKFVFVVSKN